MSVAKYGGRNVLFVGCASPAQWKSIDACIPYMYIRDLIYVCIHICICVDIHGCIYRIHIGTWYKTPPLGDRLISITYLNPEVKRTFESIREDRQDSPAHLKSGVYSLVVVFRRQRSYIIQRWGLDSAIPSRSVLTTDLYYYMNDNVLSFNTIYIAIYFILQDIHINRINKIAI